MSRGDIGCAILAAALLIAVVAFFWWNISLALACGDRGGDIYWASWFRHVCIDHNGVLLP